MKNLCDSLQSIVNQLNDSIQSVYVKNTTLMEVQSKLLGELQPSDYIAGFIFAMIGMFIRWVYKTYNGVKYNPKTPNTFLLGYWIKDNLLTKLLSFFAMLCVVFITLRFPNELGGFPFSMWYAFTIGLTLDYIVDKLKEIKPERKKVYRKSTKI